MNKSIEELKKCITISYIEPCFTESFGLSSAEFRRRDNPQAIYELVRRNQIPYIRVSERRIRFSVAQLRQWIEDGGNKKDKSDA